MHKINLDKTILENLYRKYNKTYYIKEDPVLFLHNKKFQEQDIEIVGLIASSLAVGRVSQILNSIRVALEPMKERPFDFLMNSNQKKIVSAYFTFKHRFFAANHIVALMLSMKQMIEQYGSVNAAFYNGIKEDDVNIKSGLERFVRCFRKECGSLIPSPSRGSACKRLLLFLRWMVRKDNIDLGVWHNIKPALLIVPLDTHLFRIGKKAGIIRTTSANMKAAEELTLFFRRINPDDPIKYDFALSHAGMDGLL